MPFVSIAGKLIMFHHVPRCAGSSMEDYLKARFGVLGFLNRSYERQPAAQRWLSSSPQHVALEDLNRLIHPAFFARNFAIVRHPVDRILSVFRFQQDVEKRIPPEAEFDTWLDTLPEALQKNPFYLDNHARPMVDLVARSARVFQLEKGLEPVVDFLDKLAGYKDKDPAILVTNSYTQRVAKAGGETRDAVKVRPETRAKIAQIYAEDFKRFGYDPD